MIAEFWDVSDRRWAAFLARVPHDFYHLPEYLAMSAKHGGCEAKAFYASSGRAELLMPLLLRRLPLRLGAPVSWRDAVTPYGYPCPLFWPADNPEELHPLLQALGERARAADIITAFIRLHPLLPLPMEVLRHYAVVVHHGQTVSIDLTLSLEEMWSKTRENHRRNIGRLSKLGYKAVLDDWGLLPDFVQIYRATMSRLGAEDQYDFPDAYFDDLRASLGDKLHLCAVLDNKGRPASAGLFTACNDIMQYHLGGTGEDYLPVAPSKLMFHFMRLWGKETGQRLLHLGGGVGGKTDPLFEFKAGFSDLHSDFHTCRMVFDEERNRKLLQLFVVRGGRDSDDRTTFFPLYRQDLPSALQTDRGPVIVLGAGGHAKVVIGALRSCGYSATAVYDDDPTKVGSQVLGVPVKGPLSAVPDTEETRAVLAIGDNHVRQKSASEFKRVQWVTGIHSKAYVDPNARLGPGTVVLAGAVVQADAVVGRHAIVNTSASIDHDCLVGDFAHIAPGARVAGRVQIGEGVLLGVGSSTIPGVSIGSWSVVGAGAAVVSDLPANVVAVGVPAKVKRPLSHAAPPPAGSGA